MTFVPQCWSQRSQNLLRIFFCFNWIRSNESYSLYHQSLDQFGWYFRLTVGIDEDNRKNKMLSCHIEITVSPNISLDQLVNMFVWHSVSLSRWYPLDWQVTQSYFSDTSFSKNVSENFELFINLKKNWKYLLNF